jgi:hypothetical protein
MSEGRIDTIAGPPDSTRPRNPWPRLLAFFAAIGVLVFGLGYCVVSVATPPPRELRIARDAIEIGLPLFVPVTPFGADRDGFTYGAWVTYDGTRAAAYLGRSPETLCRLSWDAVYQYGTNQVGAFVDRCGDARYDFEGEVLDGSAPKDMDVFPVQLDRGDIVVDITRLRLGHCREAGAAACSPEGDPQEISVPTRELGPRFAVE